MTINLRKFKPSPEMTRRLVRGALILSAILLILPVLFYFTVRSGFFGRIPGAEAMEAIDNPVASELYAADGSLLGKYFIENRKEVSFDEIAPDVIHALIATEDKRFFDHSGVDYRSLGRVLIKSILLGKDTGGGSTITQQLAKNLFPRQDHGLLTMPVNKTKEMIMARRLERVYTKEELLELYLNTVPFGEMTYGIGTASERYFSTTPAQLTTTEAATLIGMLKANTAYNPRLNPAASLQRRNVVLSLMADQGYLDPGILGQLEEEPVALRYNRVTDESSKAPYLLAHIRQELRDWFKEHPKEDGSLYDLYRDGLKVYTSIDPVLQQYAREAVAEQMEALQAKFTAHWQGKYPWGNNDAVFEDAVKRSERYRSLKEDGLDDDLILENFRQQLDMTVFSYEGPLQKTMSPADSIIYYLQLLSAGFVAMDPRTGAVKAWVGGIDQEFNRIDHVVTPRQVGSTFKPIVYAQALENEVSPCKYYDNQLITYQDYENWTPQNAGGGYGGAYSLAGGLANSVNTVSVQVLMQDAGIEPTVALARSMGIEGDIPPVPSIALGTAEVSLLEMAGAYGSFANQGRRVKPVYLLRIEDQNGKIIFQAETFPEQQVLQTHTTLAINKMLQGVVDSGTARSLRTVYGIRAPIAGKTGTTQNQSDGWFIGFTPGLVAGAWVGAEDRRIHFRTLSEGQGAKTALPVFALFMRKVEADPSLSRQYLFPFPDLPLELEEELDCPLYSEEEAAVLNEEKGAFEDFLDNIFKKRSPREKSTKKERRQERREKRKEERRRKREERKDG